MGCPNHLGMYYLHKEDQQKASNILKEISEIKLRSLVRLNISRNNISTIERINQIFMPQLAGIFISRNKPILVGNKTHKATDLVKTNWPCLNMLSMSKK